MSTYAEQAVERVSWRGVTLNRRTVAMLELAEQRSGITIRPTQGSYNRGGVSASSGTHDGGGAVDVSVSGLSSRQIRKLVRALRDVGFAAWHRLYIAGLWPAHIHAIAIGDRELAPLAASQVVQYVGGLDGLAARRTDAMSYRPDPIPRFSFAAWARKEEVRARRDELQADVEKLQRQLARKKSRLADVKTRLAGMEGPLV